MHAVQKVSQCPPGVFTIHHRDRLEHNPIFDRLGFQLVAFYSLGLFCFTYSESPKVIRLAKSFKPGYDFSAWRRFHA
jgi:hypothetical protein